MLAGMQLGGGGYWFDILFPGGVDVHFEFQARVNNSPQHKQTTPQSDQFVLGFRDIRSQYKEL